VPDPSQPIRVELDVSYPVPIKSGIGTYTAALAEELTTSPDVELTLLTRLGQVDDPRLAGIPQRKRRLLDQLRVPAGTTRLVPHQLRPPPLSGSTIVTVLDLIHLGAWSSAPKRLAQRALLRLFKRANISVVTISHATRSRLLSEGFDPHRVRVCQPTLPASGRQSAVGHGPPACGGGGFVYVGNLRKHKGVATLVAAHAQLASTTGLPLHIVTTDSDDIIRVLAAAYPDDLRSSLCVHRAAPDEERDALLRYAIACVAPSYEEGYGYSIVESAATGTPVIASLIAAHLETGLGRDVTYFAAGDVDGLFDAMSAQSTSTRATHVSPDDQRRVIQERIGIASVIRGFGPRDRPKTS
jgi:glycosyltransferase involved in cell wall biosynthesis